MGTEVTGSLNVAELVQSWVRSRKLSQVEGDRLLGQLMREAFGLAGRQSKESSAKYSKLKRELGVVPSAELFADAGCDVTVCARLDWQTGTEIAA